MHKVIVLTGYGNIATAVTAVKLGAMDYLAKPADADDIFNALTRQGNEKPELPENPMSADRVRWEHIQRVYEMCERNVSETARRLNMHRRHAAADFGQARAEIAPQASLVRQAGHINPGQLRRQQALRARPGKPQQQRLAAGSSQRVMRRIAQHFRAIAIRQHEAALLRENFDGHMRVAWRKTAGHNRRGIPAICGQRANPRSRI